MKKFLLFLATALLLPVAVGAQPVQKVLGHYDNDSINATGVSVTSSGTRSIAIILDPDELEIYQGGKITAIRVGLSEAAPISKVFVIPVSGSTYGERTEWDCEMNAAGWNVFELPTPYDINLGPEEKLLVGFYYQQTTGVNSLSFVNVGNIYDTYTYTKSGNRFTWKAVGTTGYGNLSLQCVVEKDSYPDYLIDAYNLRTNPTVQAGDMLPLVFNVHNRGIKHIDAGGLTADVLIDGRQITTFTNERPFDSGGYCAVETAVPTAGLSSDTHSLTVNLVAVDGVELENPITLETEFNSYRQAFPRQKHLVEQFTSTYCTYCPLGNSMLSILTSQRDDIIWVGIHGNLGAGVDPYRSNQGDSIMAFQGGNSYPSGSFDRSTGWNDDVSIANGLGYYEEYHQLVAEYLGEFFDFISEANPTFAEVNADCSFNEATRMATVAVQGRVSPDFDLMVGEDARLTVYLTEDGLVAPQLNAGTWVNNYVHNGVFRKALGSIKGEALNKVNDGYYKNVYRVSIPSGWDWTKMHVVAFISRPITNYVHGYTDMFVNNANVFSFRASDAVEEIVSDPNAVPVEFYDVMGRRYDEPQQGVNIVKMSDGTSRKILVK